MTSKTMTVRSAQETAGKISTGNSKMPGTTYAIDAFACKRGSKLAKVAGTPCSVCYARKLQRLRPSVDKGWKANLAKWEASTDVDQWTQAIAFQIIRYNSDGYHRWFDSGDLQGVDMLDAIVTVCRMTPAINHWLPTQESGFVRQWIDDNGPLPSNLVVRVSASKIDGALPKGQANWCTSNVVSSPDKAPGWKCPARDQGNQCGDCRACWDSEVSNVSYIKH